jgi:6-phosphogluconolactonase
MATEALLERLPDGRRPRVMRIEGELGDQAAAGAYEKLVREELGNHPRLDFALLGLGPDGHTASLFPGKPAVEEHRRLAAPVPEAGMDPQVPRVTLTLPVFNSAREVVFLIAGADKAEAVVRAFGDPPDESAPSAHVRPGAGTLDVVLDAPAAARLERAS